jgi:hypothetical protein
MIRPYQVYLVKMRISLITGVLLGAILSVSDKELHSIFIITPMICPEHRIHDENEDSSRESGYRRVAALSSSFSGD